jgi:hypothetical protein
LTDLSPPLSCSLHPPSVDTGSPTPKRGYLSRPLNHQDGTIPTKGAELGSAAVDHRGTCFSHPGANATTPAGITSLLKIHIIVLVVDYCRQAHPHIFAPVGISLRSALNRGDLGPAELDRGIDRRFETLAGATPHMGHNRSLRSATDCPSATLCRWSAGASRARLSSRGDGIRRPPCANRAVDLARGCSQEAAEAAATLILSRRR